MLRGTDFVWNFLAGFLLIIAFFMLFHGRAFGQGYSPEEECGYLPAGEYYLQVINYSTDIQGEVTLTAESLVTPENKQGLDLLAEKVPAGEGTVGFTFNVPQDARNVVLRMTGGEVGGWHLQSVHLMCYDNYLLTLLFFLLAVGVWLYGSRYYRKEHNTALCLIGLGLLASFPLFGDYLVNGCDLDFHLARINGIYEGLRTGQFPVRINPVQLHGYGYITGAMYPQLFLYIPALLKFLNISTTLGLKLLILGANLSTAFLAYYAVRRLTRNHRIALMAAAMYTLSPYRLTDFYSRGALGEGLALVFLPLVLWGTYEILWGRREKWWILALGMTGVLSSHILSLEFDAVLISLETVLWLFSKKKDQIGKRILAMGKASLSTIALNLYFIGPFLRFAQENPMCFKIKNRPDLCKVDLIRVFEPLSHWSDFYTPWGTQGSMSVTLGSVTLAGIVLFIACLLKNGEKGQQAGLMELGKRCLILGSLFLVAALWVTPWEKLMQIEWLESMIQAVQFPWRLLGLSSLFFSIVTAIAVAEWERVLTKSIPLWAFMLCGLLFECGSYYADMSYSAETISFIEAEAEDLGDDLYLIENSAYVGYFDTRFSHITCDVDAHFKWIIDRWNGLERECEEPENVVWSNYARDGLHISADVLVEDSVGESVEASFPLHHYPGYRVLIDGEKTDSYSHYTYLTCEITPGEHHIEISYTGLPFFRLCDVITLCSAASPALWQGIQYFKRKRKNMIDLDEEKMAG